MSGKREYCLAKTLFDKAERFIRSGQILAADGDFDSAASRLYYAMFYIAEGLLEVKGVTYSSHKGVISAFGQLFARTREIDPHFHQALLTAFSQRQLGDYRLETDLQRDDIDVLLSQANEFLTVARDWLQSNRE
jgi:uncharacterized protein (UPF0332 family)